MIHKTTRSILSVLLAVLLLVTSIPLTPAFAGGGGAVSPQPESGEGRALAGDGTKEDPYKISSAAELEEFRDKVNNGETDAWAELTADINLNPDMEISEDGTVTNGDDLDQWTPIGNSSRNSYRGTFNGDGHTISGLYIDSNADCQGLFGYVSGSGKIEKLSVSGTVSGGMYVGGVVRLNNGSVEDCDFTGSVSGSYVGGVVGVNGGNVINCTNTGTVTGTRTDDYVSDVGGVVGYNHSSVTNCYNTGTVTGPESGNNNRVGGVVGRNDGSVKNCYNTGTVTGSGNSVGGVVGYNSGSSTVENCTNTGEVSGPNSGSDSNVGGVVGQNSGTVKNCYNTGAVSGVEEVGGVVGNNYNGSVENSYNTGAVSGVEGVGGVVGQNSGGTVENCYNTGKVTGVSGSSGYVGGVVGWNVSGGTVTGCYFLQGTAGSGIGVNEGNDSADATPVDDLTDQEQFQGWDFDNTWRISTDKKHPVLQANAEDNALSGTGKQEDPYKIYRAIDLKNFRDLVNGTNGNPAAWAVLMNNIDLSSVCGESNSWTPIGTSSSNSYRGTFDGNGHKIENLYINTTDSEAENQGLFGLVGRSGKVQNLTVSGSVKGHSYVGGVVGYNNGGTVTGCIFSGSGSVSGSYSVGGVVGRNFGGTVENCYNTGSVNGSADSSDVGGVVGWNRGNVTNCYNTGSVSGPDSGFNNAVGGVVGNNEASVTNCYNTGSVSGPDSGFFNAVGGVVGLNSSGDSSASASVTNCYNTGKVTGSADSSDVGGVVGYNSSASVANCYYQTGKGAAVGIGGTTGDNSSQTAAKSLEDFHSGEVAYLLEKGVTDEKPVWGQDLTDKNSLPTLVALDKNAKTVYQVTLKYDHAGAQDKTYYTDDTATPSEQPSRDGYTFDHWDKTEGEGNTITYTAQWTPVADPDPEPEEPPYTGKYSYELSTSVGDHGSLTVDRYATEGDKVTITVSPDEAYKLDDLVVTAGGKDVELTANSDGTYSFTMPSADVRITATFAEDPDWTEPEEPATDVSDIFIDVAPDAWYKDAIQYAYDNGLMTGVSATEFAPEATTTRAMIVSILARLENVTSAEAAGFADVDDNDWYATAVNWAANVGVVNGYEDNTFQPNTAITREQLAAILMNYAAYKGEDVSNRADLTTYTDQPSTWAEEAMSWAVAEGLISGVTNDQLQPQGNATRAQVAAILQRYLEA